ncbi:hypothetical protein [Paractinoplanes bogorensis]|uniref:hypothetical protein n=1 Tax=Paractinoplanes bogorensis TaxID=1610840 RepID=UPI001FE69FD5|nr:hypothetical protein [Actinoplanes bogorensis]
MIPADWMPHRRGEDDELLGYLRPVDDRFRPVTVFGYPLGDVTDEHEARQILDAVGLSYLAGRWLLALDGRPEPIAVEIVEASPERLRVKNVDFGFEENIGAIFTLDVPPGDALRLQ